MTNSVIRVGLIDDHKLLVDSLQMRMKAAGDMEVVFTSTNAGDGLRAILETKPDVAVLDVDLPGRGTFDIASDLRSRHVATRILFLTAFASDVLIDQALRLKAHGYLLKSEPIEQLLDAVRAVARGEWRFSKEVEQRIVFDPNRRRYTLATPHPLSTLTLRQLEVLRHLARGESVKEVARQMHLSQKSVDSHKYRIMHKLGIHDRVELARYAIREGLLLP